MKKTIIALALLTSSAAFADSVLTSVGAFKGKVSIENSGLDIKSLEVEVVNQFCNFWGTTCAGGPRDAHTLPLITRESADGKFISILHDSVTELSSTKIGNRFSSCKVNLVIEAVNAEGRNVQGSKDLAWINDKKVCSDSIKLTQIVRENLSKTLTVKDGGIFVSIK